MEFKKKSLYSPMFPNQWTPIKLYELAEWINGKAFKKDDYNITGLPVIKIAELNTGLSSNTKYSINNDEKFYIKKGDILFAWSGNPDTSIDTHKFKEKEGYLNQHIFKVLPNDNKIESDFLYYILKYLKPFFKEIARNKQTTGLGHVTISDLKKIQVRIPSENIQKEIADIFIILDSKIEINNKIISNLESQAQAIFKSWFVDFEPFQDGNFVESELGMIPEGWEVKELGEIINLYDNKRVPISKMDRDKMEKNYPYYGANGIIDYVDNYLFDGKYLLMGEDGTVRTEEGFPILNYVDEKFWVSNHAHIMRGTLVSTEYIYLLLSKMFINNIVTGAVQEKINQRNLKKIKIIFPEKKELESFEKIIEPMFKMKLYLNNQNTKLAELRDALLPKLMAGEIDVSNIKIEGEEVKNE
ncbi:MAG: restriction endonuclease subunit S, partial [Finegoldia magna]|uniref:restriction endonuclease subunit S n=1 Tax=Finegoldia magna TaxID=1260 RepID=UPI000D98B817|nr:restriction endonuclease subunit S [Finegoldia magna]MDU2639047.1 restriction endonuclease subunit S [Finegoldia magna]PWV48071.1 type I restriction enzyme S subunit [Finegoldia magna]